MKLMLVRHLWGVDQTSGLSKYGKAWRDFGYEAIEASLGQQPDPAAFLRFRADHHFAWIPQVFSRDFQPGGTVAEHLRSLRQQVEACLDHQPLFINAHSGTDGWSPAEAEDFFGQALALEQRIGIPRAHATHRLPYSGRPCRTRDLLQKLPDLKLTCDFSHWVCVCERLLPDLGDIVSLCAQRCLHLHARVGYEEGPQVPDPAAPEYATHLAAHEAWWDEIWQAQRGRGCPCSTLTPEFGPPPYLHELPYSRRPAADLPAICDWMAGRLRTRFQGSGAA